MGGGGSSAQLPHPGLRPWTHSLPPDTPSFPLYTRPSRIGGGDLSSPYVHSLCQTLRTELHNRAYATRAYFFTALLHNILLKTFGTYKKTAKAIFSCCLNYGLTVEFTIFQFSDSSLDSRTPNCSTFESLFVQCLDNTFQMTDSLFRFSQTVLQSFRIQTISKFLMCYYFS